MIIVTVLLKTLCAHFCPLPQSFRLRPSKLILLFETPLCLFPWLQQIAGGLASSVASVLRPGSVLGLLALIFDPLRDSNDMCLIYGQTEMVATTKVMNNDRSSSLTCTSSQ